MTQTMDSIFHGVKIKMSVEYADRNPHMIDSDHMDHWKCRIRCGQQSMTVYFSKGMGHNGVPPTLHEVLDCLASDAAGYENSRSFEDWRGDYGYDTDSRKAERIYKTVSKQAESLKRVLGDELYKTLLWDTERL